MVRDGGGSWPDEAISFSPVPMMALHNASKRCTVQRVGSSTRKMGPSAMIAGIANVVANTRSKE